MKLSLRLGFLGFALSLFGSTSAFASCAIHNDTPWSFVVTSGNTSNQVVGSHTQTHIAAGKIIGKSKEGKTIGGVCKDGDSLEIKNERGIPILIPKG
jgi:hypothetical protein